MDCRKCQHFVVEIIGHTNAKETTELHCTKGHNLLFETVMSEFGRGECDAYEERKVEKHETN